MRTMRIAISGATGTGKTTLTRLMAQLAGVSVVMEPSPSALLRTFDLSPFSSCFDLQKAIILGRVEAERLIEPTKFRVLDRTVQEDIEIFAELHRRQGFLTDRQLSVLSDLAADVVAETGPPDVFVLMSADQALLLERLRRAGAPTPVIDSLPQQVALYKEWMGRCRTTRLPVNTTAFDIKSLQNLAVWIHSTVVAAHMGEAAHDANLAVAWIVE